MDAFWVLMLISLAAVPLALTLREVNPHLPLNDHFPQRISITH
jgi:hypothetical protein